ncbi:MAG: hypothetical protein U9Q81_24465 [Pseudomonadota bacterium]|nr:hypothetical protein [Pseudomonadota bacterium]
MANRNTTPEAGSVDQAMNRVLAAEREAVEAVERCRMEAARILTDAEEQARRVSRRVDERIKAANRIADKSVEGSLREILGSEPEAAASGARDIERLDRAVHALVSEIIGSA